MQCPQAEIDPQGSELPTENAQPEAHTDVDMDNPAKETVSDLPGADPQSQGTNDHTTPQTQPDAPDSDENLLLAISSLMMRGNREISQKITNLTAALASMSPGSGPGQKDASYDADSEQEDLPRRKVRERKDSLTKALFVCQSLFLKALSDVVNCKKIVRTHLEGKGVRAKPKDPLPSCANPQEVSAYEDNTHPGPDVNCIKLDWTSSFKIKWNQQALSFLARDLLAQIRDGHCSGIPKDFEIDEAGLQAMCEHSLERTQRRFRILAPRGSESTYQAAERASQKKRDDARTARQLGRRHSVRNIPKSSFVRCSLMS